MHAGQYFRLSFAILTLGALSGCNTVEGFGRDLESLGEGLQSTASDESGSATASRKKQEEKNAQTGNKPKRGKQSDKTSTRFNQWQQP